MNNDNVNNNEFYLQCQNLVLKGIPNNLRLTIWFEFGKKLKQQFEISDKIENMSFLKG